MASCSLRRSCRILILTLAYDRGVGLEVKRSVSEALDQIPGEDEQMSVLPPHDYLNTQMPHIWSPLAFLDATNSLLISWDHLLLDYPIAHSTGFALSTYCIFNPDSRSSRQSG